MVTMLFAQLATAAYACPSRQPCAMTEDAAHPALCAKHCQPDSPAPEPVHVLPLGGPPPDPVLSVAPAEASGDVSAAWTARRLARDRAPPPALGVLHCCYRL
jgi:hypothetical protein